MKESVPCPTNIVSMVCLESANFLAPSMFGTQLLSDPPKVFQRRIYIGDVQQENAQDYWNAKNYAAYDQGALGTSYDQQTNLKRVKIFLSHWDRVCA